MGDFLIALLIFALGWLLGTFQMYKTLKHLNPDLIVKSYTRRQ